MGFFREIIEEVTGQERRRGCLEEAGSAYSGRGEDGDGRGVEGYTWHGWQHESDGYELKGAD